MILMDRDAWERALEQLDDRRRREVEHLTSIEQISLSDYLVDEPIPGVISK